MITNTNKWITAVVLIILLLVFSGFGFFKPRMNGGEDAVNNITELTGKTLGGVVSRMPDNSVKLLFEGILGQKLGGYRSYKRIDEVLNALRTGEIKAAWMPDVTAEYILNTEAGFKELETPEPDTERFSFGLAVRNDEEGAALRDELNSAISTLRSNGKLDELASRYTTYSATSENARPEGGNTENNEALFTIDDMQVNNSEAAKDWDKLYIAITGAIPPLEQLDEASEPYGYCVELMDNIGMLINKKIEFVVLTGETYFTELMAGRIDAVFAYGSGMITVESA